MIKWSMSAEFIAFVIIIMIELFAYERGQIETGRRKVFKTGVWLTELSILLDIVSVILIEQHGRVPYWLNMTLNTAYFLVSVWMCTAIAAYFFELLLQHVYDKSCRRKAVVGLRTIVSIHFLIVVANLWTGWIFWFDEKGYYHRGILNKVGYLFAVIELAMVLMCFFRNRASVEKSVVRVMRTFPVIVLLLVGIQVAFPVVLLNGTIVAFADIMIFMNFQNSQAEKDGLTGLGNRKKFFDELSLRLKGKQQFQIILVSLNNFATINQKFGYKKGDEFLYRIGHWLDNFQNEGSAFRFGNVAFALLCPYESEEKSQRLLEQVQQRFREPWRFGDIPYKVSSCFVMMNCKKPDWEATHIMEILSFMIENAKANDSGCVEFNTQIEQMFRQKENLLALLKDSVRNKRFQVWYQPIFDCKKQKFVSAEALLRLRDYEGTMISPAEFVPLAEENGMIEELGWFVWEEVGRFLRMHPELSLEYISVNMSMQQFTNPDLYEKIRDCLERNRLEAGKIKMEITERVVLNDVKYMNRVIEEFSAKGLKFCIDDFGTGYSNFSSVMHLPFEVIKLDQSLMKELSINPKDRMAVQSMLDMFHGLGLKVVSEGIETKEQQEMIQKMGTDYIQGFYYAKPMPEAEVVEFLKTHDRN